MASGGLEQSRGGPGGSVPVSQDETYEHIDAPMYFDFSRLVESKLMQLLPREPDNTSNKDVNPTALSPSQPSQPRDESGKRIKEKGDCDSLSSPISGDSFFDLPGDEGKA